PVMSVALSVSRVSQSAIASAIPTAKGAARALLPPLQPLASSFGPRRGMMRRMNPRVFLDVDPRTLHLPTTRLTGADPAKLQRQIARHGKSTQGMPPIEVYRGTDGELMIYNGVTRATRVAKLLPGHLIRVEVIDDLRTTVGHLPTVGD